MYSKTVYHGTIYNFEVIDISKGKGYKDFGPGFYTTGVKDHAIRMARRNKIREIARLREDNLSFSSVKAYLYEYEFDTSAFDNCLTRIFSSADEEWIKFVLTGRGNRSKKHVYDIVKGPTADDDTRTTFNDFRRGVFGGINSEKALRRLIEDLEVYNLPMQLYFGTQLAVNNLKLKRKVCV